MRIEETHSLHMDMTTLVQQIADDEKLVREVEEGSKFEEIQLRYQQAVHRR